MIIITLIQYRCPDHDEKYGSYLWGPDENGDFHRNCDTCGDKIIEPPECTVWECKGVAIILEEGEPYCKDHWNDKLGIPIETGVIYGE